MGERRRMGRRAKALIAVGASVIVLSGGLALALFLTSPSRDIGTTLLVEKPIPEEWIEPPLETEGVVSVPSWTSEGSLALLADGRAFGEETYRIDVSPEGATLSSSGRFWFRVVVANVAVTFRQEWAGTPRLDPIRYFLHVDAPLGRGYEASGRLDAGTYLSERGGETTRMTAAPERAVILGMFSTYALLPARFSEQEHDNVASFDVLLFGGPPGSAATDSGTPTVTVSRSGVTAIEVRGSSILADRYEIRSPFGNSMLYARGHEFLALSAGTTERPLLVYRTDYFPDGPPRLPQAL